MSGFAMRVSTALLAMAGLLGAGCLGETPTDVQTEAGAAAASGIANADNGTLEGVVINDEEMPIEGARVTAFHVLMEETHTATAAADGRFSFPSVRPGVYELSAQALFFLNATKEAEVIAGQAVFVTFELVDVVKSALVIETFVQKGFLNCSIATVGDGQMYGPANYCEPLGSDRAKFPLQFMEGGTPTGVVLEAVWTPATPVTGTALELSLCNRKDGSADPRNCRDVVDNTYFRWIRGGSPLVLRVHDLPWSEFQAYDTVVGDGGITGIRVPVTFQQSFDLWISICYVDVCPPDFSARPPA